MAAVEKGDPHITQLSDWFGPPVSKKGRRTLL
jgi:hypothetical protein